MKKGISLRAALLVLALVVACATTVGGTLAWFTDEDVSEVNIIQAGNLDVELLNAEGKKLEAEDQIFKSVNLWEPGCLTYGNFKVANDGNLDFQYKLSINYIGENAVVTEATNDAGAAVIGPKLSDVLQVAFVKPIDGGEDGVVTREEVLAMLEEAKAAGKAGSIDNYYLVGELSAKGAVDENGATADDGIDDYGVIIYWESTTPAFDNQFNLVNGKTTTDGQPLHIELGVKVYATQVTSESDGIDNQYDAGAKLYEDLPYAEVISLTAPVTTSKGEGTVHGATFVAAEDISVTNPEYLEWAADFEVSADKKVPSGAIALAGQYDDFGEGWLVIENGFMDIEIPELQPNVSIGVMEYALKALNQGQDTDQFIPYQMVAEVVQKFNCGIVIMDPTMLEDGTTFSVQLKMYPTENGAKVPGEAGYPIGGTYTYTYKAE